MSIRIKKNKNLKAKRKKTYYKNTNSWLDAVYRNNKNFIDESIQKVQDVYGAKLYVTKKTFFKNQVKAYKEQGYSNRQSLNLVSNSSLFKTEEERIVENAWTGIRTDKEAFNKLRRLTGWKKKIDESSLEYIGEKKYKYGTAIINFENSPFNVVIYDASAIY